MTRWARLRKLRPALLLLLLTSCVNVPPSGVSLNAGTVIIHFKICPRDQIARVTLTNQSGAADETAWEATLVDRGKRLFAFPLNRQIPGFRVVDRTAGGLREGIVYATDAETRDGIELVGIGFHSSDLREGAVLTRRSGKEIYVPVATWNRQTAQCTKDRPYLIAIFPIILLIVLGIALRRRASGTIRRPETS